MKKHLASPDLKRPSFLSRLAKDRAGNTLALMGAALFPILGMIGGGVDMSRAYLAQARLQQACDAGVLAAKKRLGALAPKDDVIPTEVAEAGQRFFNINYRDGIYDTNGRKFTMYLEKDYSVSGEAEVIVPTAVMAVFGFETMPVKVECQAQMSFSNVDVVMALDVTGSMRHTNPGDTLPRIDSLKQVIRNFHDVVEKSKGVGMRVRYGFVPYATNVNVGHILDNKWVVDEWTYQSRVLSGELINEYTKTFTENWQTVSGSRTGWITESSYAATWYPGSPPSSGSGDSGGSSGSSGYYKCEGSQPADTDTSTDTLVSTTTEPWIGPPSGTKTIEHRRRVTNGTDYYTSRSGATCEIKRRTYNNYTQTYDRVSHPAADAKVEWLYKPVLHDTRKWAIETTGCIEERATYHVEDAATVDLTQALDLDIDLIPDQKDPTTQWRPQYNGMIYVRSLNNSGGGSVTPEEVTSTQTFAQTGSWWFSGCPAPSQKLQAMDSTALDNYLAKLSPAGATYHDIGMIWAGRLISPSGLFAKENQDVNSETPTNRNLIFLTDGQTEPYDISYGAYGVDALDQRRWDETSTKTLAEIVETRFLIACNEVKKKNVTVWVIAFGTEVNDAMVECAGPGKYFEAADADQLDDAFRQIAESFGNLRISE